MDEKRKAYLKERIPPFTPLTAMEEASRCLLCHEAPCSAGCPAGTDPAKFIRSIRFRNFKGAAETIRRNNILGGICARICPYDRTCEEACSRTGIDVPIQIGRLQRFITDFEKALDMRILSTPVATLEKVAVIGAGPAGLAAAAQLALMGYEVSLFEKNEKAGGVLSYGIVPGRLPQEIVDWEIRYIKDLGVEFVHQCQVGHQITLADLRKQGYQAFFLAMGLQQSRNIELPGMNLAGVDHALNFLARAKPAEGAVSVGEHAVIIGGGDVAMDCATTSKMLGNKVTIIYRRKKTDMPAMPTEVAHVLSLGVDLITESLPVALLGEENRLVAVRAKGIDGVSEHLIKADQVIFAIGQVFDEGNLAEGLERTEDGLICVSDQYGATSVSGVFAAGDAVNGGKSVVQAVADGKSAAEGINAWLAGRR